MEEHKNTGQIVYASTGRRLVASLIDGLILSIFYIPISIVTNATATSNYGANSSYAASGISTILTLILMVIQFAYYVYFIGSRGQTPGKMAMGVKVVRKDAVAPVGYGKAFMREFVGKFISSLILALGYLWILWDKEKQGWHDKIAGTIVVRT